MVNFNGTLHPSSKPLLSISNRGLNYGDAVFETLRFSVGKINFWEDHYFRLMASMRILRMEIPMDFTLEFLESEILKTLDASNEKDASCRIKLLVWRKEGGKYTPKTRNIEYCISCEKIESPFYTLQNEPCEVELFKDHYIASGLLSTLKSSSRLINILGGIFAEENGYQNCLLLNESKQVVEALNGNLFLLNGSEVKTPPLSDGCLNGILRKQLIEIIKLMPDYSLNEASISPFELQKADGLFITNVVSGIVPITKYRKKQYKSDFASVVIPKLNVRARMG